MVDAFYLVISLFCYPLKHLIPHYLYFRMQLYVYPLLKVAQCMCIWTMVLVTIDRYVYVCVPLRALMILTPRRRRLLAVGVPVMSVLYNMPRFFDSCLMIFENSCGEILDIRKVFLPVFNSTIYYNTYLTGCYIVLVFLLPLTCLTILNTKMVMTIRRSRMRHQELGRPREENECNGTLVLVIIIVVFIVCESPELIVKIMVVIDSYSDSVNILAEALDILVVFNELMMVVNSSVNFAIYMTLSNRFCLILMQIILAFRKRDSTKYSSSEVVPLQHS